MRKISRSGHGVLFADEMHYTFLLTAVRLLALFTVLIPVAGRAQAKRTEQLVLTKCWASPMADRIAAISAWNEDRLFVGREGALIEARDGSGVKIWSSELGGAISSNLQTVNSSLVLVTSAADSITSGADLLRSLSRETGVANWTLPLPSAERYYLGTYNGSVIVVSGSGGIHSVDSKSGVLKWKREIADKFATEPAFAEGRVIVASNSSQVFTLSLSTGEIESVRRLPFPVSALAETPGGELVVGDERGNLTSLAGGDKVDWRFRAGGQISSVYGNGNGLIAASYDNYVYYLNTRSGDVIWKHRLAGRASQVVNIGDKHVLITGSEESGAVILDSASGKVVGQIVLGTDESVVTEPMANGDSIIIVSNRAVYQYSLNGCSDKEKERPADSSVRRIVP